MLWPRTSRRTEMDVIPTVRVKVPSIGTNRSQLVT